MIATGNHWYFDSLRGQLPPGDFVATKSHRHKAIMQLFPSEISKIALQFWGGRVDDPPLRPTIDKCTELPNKYKFILPVRRCDRVWKAYRT